MKAVQKTFGPLTADRAAGFEDYLQQVVGPDDYTRRGSGGDVYFDLAAMPSPTITAELENLVGASILRDSLPTWPANRGPQYRESRINVFDSSYAEPWAAKRRKSGDFTWDVFKS